MPSFINLYFIQFGKSLAILVVSSTLDSFKKLNLFNMTFNYGKEKLTLKKTFALAQGKTKGVLIPEIKSKVEKSNAIVHKVVHFGRTVYGINTGFGPLCDTLISENETKKLQRNLLISHAVGVGDPILPLLSKIMMSGVFSEPLKLWASILPSSLFFNFLFFMSQKYFFYARLSLKEILLGL